MNEPLPLTRELLLIGGGHTHALILRMWGMRPLAGVRLTVVNPHPSAPYTGMLPGFVAGHYSREDLDIDLVRLARFAGARIILDNGAWGLVRASSNTPNLVVVCESPESEIELKAIFDQVDEFIRTEPAVGDYDQTI